jgi:hypothetical protein
MSVQTSALLCALQDLNNGDFNASMPLDWDGNVPTEEVPTIVSEFNAITARQRYNIEEMERIRLSFKCGDLAQRACTEPNAKGGWVSNVQTFNDTLETVTEPIKYMVAAIDSLRMGDLTREPKKWEHLDGEYSRAYSSIQELMNMLRKFTAEVTNVTCDIGMGELGTTANSDGLAGKKVDLML